MSKKLTAAHFGNELMRRFKETDSSFGNLTARENKLIVLAMVVYEEIEGKELEKHVPKYIKRMDNSNVTVIVKDAAKIRDFKDDYL